jgi:lipopolysaccharide transport system ATP-binding protein
MAWPDGLAVRISDLHKEYLINAGTLGKSVKDDLLGLLTLRFLWQRPSKQVFTALKGISLDIRRGEVVGFLGGNGAGKSTLLKLLCRITPPTAGSIAYAGRVACILEVGTGFHPELSGRENIYLNGAILGLKRTEINALFQQIVDFAEIGPYLDEPVKHYSSGMYVRLAFAIAAHVEPDVLVIDEVLAVGDERFRGKCLGRVRSHFGGERTVLFVSHDMQTVREICTRVVVLDRGQLVFDGAVEEGIAVFRAQQASLITDEGGPALP